MTLSPRPLTSALEKWLVIAALVAIGALMVVGSFYTSATPDLAAIRVIRQAVGPEAGAIRVSGRYRFVDVDGYSSFDVQLACGTVVQGEEPHLFAALVRKSGRNSLFTVDEFAIDPGRGRPLFPREAQLLGACAP